MSSTDKTLPKDAEQIVDRVRERYGKIARGTESGCGATSCCGSSEADVAEAIGYSKEQIDAIPQGANLGVGCGAPINHLELQPGETLLDLGSGGGLDAFIAAPQVGPQGRVIGIDMTPEMIERAAANAERAGLKQVQFRQGRLEELPVEDASVDAVTSNCVINLVPDKDCVFREVARVLKPGGRMVVSDIMLDGELPRTLRDDLMAYVGCVSGALQRDDYFDRIRAAGLDEVTVLTDDDYLRKVGDNIPGEVVELFRATGMSTDDIKGTVRSVTYRAVKPA